MLFLYVFLLTATIANSKKCYEVVNHKFCHDCCDKKPISDPCSTKKCSSKTECVLHYNPNLHHTDQDPPNCTDDHLPLEPKCMKPCDKKCPANCLSFLNSDRCPDCSCDKRCKNDCLKSNRCSRNEECYLEETTCKSKKDRCCLLPKCRPKGICEAEKDCPENCLRYVDQYGCNQCHCCNACVNHKCSYGQKCVLKQVNCTKCPCPDVAECKPK